MNDSLDLRNRILKMRESNNLTYTKEDTLNNNLMSEFENSIKDDNQKELNSKKNTLIDQNKDVLSEPIKNSSENLADQKNKMENQNINSSFNDNDAQFLMLANKFNEAVEVILELSQKVEKLERNVSQKTKKKENEVNSFSFFNFKMLAVILIIPLVVIGLFTLPFDFLLIKTIILDILSSL